MAISFPVGAELRSFGPTVRSATISPAAQEDGYYATLTFDPANNEVLKMPYGGSEGILYHAASFEAAPEPSTLILLLAGGLAALACRCRRRTK